MNQATLDGTGIQELFTEKKRLEKMVEHYREEFKAARGKAKEYKKMLRAINLRIRVTEGK